MKKIIIVGLCIAFFSIVFVTRGESEDKLNVQTDFAAGDSYSEEKVLQELDTLIALSQEQNDLEQVARLYHQKGKLLIDLIRYDEALDALQKAYALIDHVTDFSLKYAINLHLGMSHSFMAMLPQSFPYYEAAYAYADSTGNPLYVARARHFAATKNLVSGEFVEAAQKLYKSYQVLTEYNDTTHLLYLCNDIGAFFAIFGENDDAIEFLNKALHYDSLANSPERSVRVMLLSNIGAVYSDNIKDYATAEKYLKEALASSRPNENWRDRFYAEAYLAKAQVYTGEYSEALSYFENAYHDERIKERTSYFPFIVAYYGLSLFKMGDYDMAQRICTEAYQLSLQMNNWELIALSLQNLYKLDSIDGNYRGALGYYQKMNEAQRSKLDEEGKMEFIRLEVEQEIEKILSKTNELQAENVEHLGTIDKLNKLSGRQKLVILVFVILALALTTELARNKRLTKRIKSSEDALKLLNQNLENKVKERTIELERANVELKQLDNAKTEFLSIISHEIRTPLNGINGVLNIFNISEFPEDLREFLEIMKVSSDRLENFSYKALDVSLLATKGKEALNLSKGNLVDTIQQCIEQNKQQAIKKELEIVARLNFHELELTYDQRFIKRAINAILDNAVKFAHERTQIVVELLEVDTTCEIVVTDIGERFPDNSETIKIRPFKTGNKHVDMNPGLSLYLSKVIFKAHGGDITLANNSDGVTVRMILPLT